MNIRCNMVLQSCIILRMMLDKCKFKLMSMLEWLLLLFLSTMSQVTTAVIGNACVIFCVNFAPYIHWIQQMPWHHLRITRHTLIHHHSIAPHMHYTTFALQKYRLRHISITYCIHCAIKLYINHRTYIDHIRWAEYVLWY